MVAILSSKHSRDPKRPVDVWLECSAVATGIVFYLLPKTPTAIVVALIAIFLLLFHPVWKLLSKYGTMRYVALLGLSVVLWWLGYTVWPERVFPWLTTHRTVVAKDKTMGLYLHFWLRTITLLPGSTLTRVPLHNVRIRVTSPVLRSDLANSWHSCEILNLPLVPEWSNYNQLWELFGLLPLSRSSTLLLVESTASNGRWSAIVLLVLVNGKMESRQVLDGVFFDPSMDVHVDEFSSGFPKDQRDIELKWGPELFRKYNVPATTHDGIRVACPSVE